MLKVAGFDHAADGYEVFRQLVPARIAEPASKLCNSRVLLAVVRLQEQFYDGNGDVRAGDGQGQGEHVGA
jgi:hypothetical protein